jgi:hypothetical protein
MQQWLAQATRPGEAFLSPHITVFASQDVQLKVCRKNNLPSFINLLRQFVYIDQGLSISSVLLSKHLK